MKFIPVMSIGFLIMLVAFFVGQVQSHEEVHKQIYRGYNINSTIEYNVLDGRAVTIAEKSCPNEYCTMAHNFNEIVSYNLDYMYWMVGLGLFVLILISELRLDLEHERM